MSEIDQDIDDESYSVDRSLRLIPCPACSYGYEVDDEVSMFITCVECGGSGEVEYFDGKKVYPSHHSNNKPWLLGFLPEIVD